MDARRDLRRRVDHPVHVAFAERERGAGGERLFAEPALDVELTRRLEQLALHDVERTGRPAVVVQVDALVRVPTDQPRVVPGVGAEADEPALVAVVAGEGAPRVGVTRQAVDDLEQTIGSKWGDRRGAGRSMSWVMTTPGNAAERDRNRDRRRGMGSALAATALVVRQARELTPRVVGRLGDDPTHSEGERHRSNRHFVVASSMKP